MFKKHFKVVEIRKSGATITHYLNGTKKAIKEDIETFKMEAKRYEMIGKSGMIVWVD